MPIFLPSSLVIDLIQTKGNNDHIHDTFSNLIFPSHQLPVPMPFHNYQSAYLPMPSEGPSANLLTCAYSRSHMCVYNLAMPDSPPICYLSRASQPLYPSFLCRFCFLCLWMFSHPLLPIAYPRDLPKHLFVGIMGFYFFGSGP